MSKSSRAASPTQVLSLETPDAQILSDSDSAEETASKNTPEEPPIAVSSDEESSRSSSSEHVFEEENARRNAAEPAQLEQDLTKTAQIRPDLFPGTTPGQPNQTPNNISRPAVPTKHCC